MTEDFYGLPAAVLDNGHLRLTYLTTAGPRIVGLTIAGGANLLAELPDVRIPTPLGDFRLLGGHRLWHAPEDFPLTYAPDDSGLAFQALDGGVRLQGPVQPLSGIRKALDICLAPAAPALTLTHRLENCGAAPVELAPWAITQLPLGGLAILPEATGPADAHGLLPNRRLALWPYTRWHDTRLHFDDGLLAVEGRTGPSPCKIGNTNLRGWAAYLRGDTALVKRFGVDAGASYPDLGCNVEVYCNDSFLELETLGPLVHLAPGESVIHVERWEVYAGLDLPPGVAGGREFARRLQE